MNLGQRIASSVPEKCNLFADHFKSTFNSSVATTAEAELAMQDTPRDAFDFGIFDVNEDIVASAIRKMKYSNAIGADGIPSSVLKKCTGALTLPLALLFNKSLQQSQFPSHWKSSIIFPIHKKGDKRNVENYRGITSLCACSKVLEIIVNDALFASCKNYISEDQHGFYPRRSVSTNLVQFVSLCLRNMDAGTQVDAIYTDLKAAFDRVDHQILLGKLEKLGVCSSLVSWFRSYLTDRILCVEIGPSQSETFSNLSGVPQGSNLGPLLFSLFINEISLLLTPECRLFYADDVKLFMVIKVLADCLRLQELLMIFGEWCSRNRLSLSFDKCNTISFQRKRSPILFEYSISGYSLKRVNQTKDLGVTLDCELTFRAHYNDIIARANRQLGFICKIAVEFRDPICLRSLYCSLVRSILESSSVAWCPYQAYWIARIERVQRKFVRYALRSLPWQDPLNLPPYEARCQLLGIATLEKRRAVAQAVFIAKILLGETDSSAILGQLQLYAPERPLRQRNFLQLETRSGEYGMHDPVRFMMMQFNNFFDLFDFNVSITVFRRRLLSVR